LRKLSWGGFTQSVRAWITGRKLLSAAWVLRMSSRVREDGSAVTPNTLVRAVTSFVGDVSRVARRSRKYRRFQEVGCSVSVACVEEQVWRPSGLRVARREANQCRQSCGAICRQSVAGYRNSRQHRRCLQALTTVLLRGVLAGAA